MKAAGTIRIGRGSLVQQKWPEPAWIGRLPEEQRGPAKVQFHLNLAAAFYSESGTLTELSRGLGFSDTALNVARMRGRVSPKLAIRIEQKLGREHFPRELFNDIFAVAE
jgi:hypothetical protein